MTHCLGGGQLFVLGRCGQGSGAAGRDILAQAASSLQLDLEREGRDSDRVPTSCDEASWPPEP